MKSFNGKKIFINSNSGNGICLVITLIFIIFTVFIFSGLEKLCVFHNITGIPCPGCGMTRAFLNFFSGDIKKALFYHPLFWMIPFLFFILFFHKYSAFLEKLYKNNLFWKTIGVIVISVYFIRLLYMFPDNEPMDFNRNALLPRIFSMLFL